MAMKIAIVRSRYTPFGGAERFVERALSALRAEGAEVTVIARSWAGAPAEGYRQLLCDPPYNRLFGRRTARDASFAEAVRQVLRRESFDIVQSHERIPGSMVFRAGDGVHAAWLERRSAGIGWLGRLAQRYSPYHRYILAAERAMFADPALRAVICNSAMVRDEIVAYYGVAADKLHVIHNGIDLDAFSPALSVHRAEVRAAHGIPEAAPLLLYVGSGFARKGVPQLLEALAALADNSVHLLVIGADRKIDAARRQAERLGIAGRVHLLGPQPDVKAFYGAADAFVLPTLYDPFPNAALEALACGLPTLTTSGCGVAEIISPGVNGVVVPPADVAALTDGLRQLLALPAAARASAREAALPLSLSAMAGRLLDFYHGLLAQSPTP